MYYSRTLFQDILGGSNMIFILIIKKKPSSWVKIAQQDNHFIDFTKAPTLLHIQKGNQNYKFLEPFQDVFDETLWRELPPHSSIDMTIELLPNSVLPKFKACRSPKRKETQSRIITSTSCQKDVLGLSKNLDPPQFLQLNNMDQNLDPVGLKVAKECDTKD